MKSYRLKNIEMKGRPPPPWLGGLEGAELTEGLQSTVGLTSDLQLSARRCSTAFWESPTSCLPPSMAVSSYGVSAPATSPTEGNSGVLA